MFAKAYILFSIFIFTDAENLVFKQNQKVQLMHDPLRVQRGQLQQYAESTVAFMVRFSENRSISHNSPLDFDQVDLDTGDHYVPGFGAFLCPDNGWYHFMWTIHAAERRAFTKLVLGETDVKYGPLTAEIKDKTSGSFSTSAILQCATGKAVGLKAVGWPDSNAINIFYAKFTSFLGFRISDDYGRLNYAMMASMKENTTYDTNTTMKFNNVSVNLGSRYNPATGIIQCPNTGIYVLEISAHASGNEAHPILSMNNIPGPVGPYSTNTYAPQNDGGTTSMLMIANCSYQTALSFLPQFYPLNVQYVAPFTALTGYYLAASTASFFASMAQDMMFFNGRTILFNNVLSNVGNNYTPYLGVFICPDNYYYLFSWSLRTTLEGELSEDEKRPAEAVLMKGDSEVNVTMQTSIPIRRSFSNSASTQAIVKCTQQLPIYVKSKISGDKPQAYTGDSSFSGFRIG